MSPKPQSRKKPITINQVGLIACIIAFAGAVYGFVTGGMVTMIVLFAECLVVGFVLIYVCASFIELLRK